MNHFWERFQKLKTQWKHSPKLFFNKQFLSEFRQLLQDISNSFYNSVCMMYGDTRTHKLSQDIHFYACSVSSQDNLYIQYVA